MDGEAKADVFDKIRALLDVPEGDLFDAVKSYLDYVSTLEIQLDAAEFEAIQSATEQDRLRALLRKLSPELEDES